MKHVFGIDLGTTYSCIAYVDEHGKPVVLKNTDGEHTTPSVVMVESSDNIIVGEEAKRAIEADPDATISFIKRKMGRENDTVVIDGEKHHAPEVSAWILKKLTQDANEDLRENGIIEDGETVKDVVITCPAYFGTNERQATKLAGELAGLNVLDIINEPTAAAISYGLTKKGENETVMVYDLGGGTFDITIMKIENNSVTVLATGGDDQLGGKDWDEALMNYAVERYADEKDEDLYDDPDVIASMYVSLEKIKKSLSARTKTHLIINGPGGRLREELTREKFEDLTHDLLERTKNLMDDTIRQAHLSLGDIDQILLVGGSSKMPQVAEMIERDYNIKPVLADPDEAVAKGAAIYANSRKDFEEFVEKTAKEEGKDVKEIKEDSEKIEKIEEEYYAGIKNDDKKLKISNVLSRSYGVGVLDAQTNTFYIENVLKMNDQIPCSSIRNFMTVLDNQDKVVFKIYESRTMDDRMAFNKQEPITQIDMKFYQKVPKDTPIKVKFSLDSSGQIRVVAKEGAYGSKLDTTFKLSNEMSDEDFKDAADHMDHTNVE